MDWIHPLMDCTRNIEKLKKTFNPNQFSVLTISVLD